MHISRSTKITILLVIDVVFFLVELIAGYAVGSLALVADSFHMLNDILSLIVALYAIKLTANRTFDNRYSYGWHRAEILAALVNGVFLLALCFSIFMEALGRFFSTPEISSPRLIVIVGSLGLASNILGLFLFHEHDHSHSSKSHDHKTNSADLQEPSPGVENGSVTPIEDIENRNSRSRSDSLYGHPVATRAYFVQAAHDLQQARSPSPVRTDNMSGLFSPQGKQGESDGMLGNDNTGLDEGRSFESAAVIQSEITPLLPGHMQQANGKPHSESVSQRGSRSNSKAGPSEPRRHGGHGHSHGSGSMNMRALVLHVLGDALGNVGVIATGLVIWLGTWSWRFYFDPVISLVITVIIFSSALPLVKSASFILLQGVPHGISLEDVGDAIHTIDGVQSIHELHIWQLSESKIVASVHVLTSKNHDFMTVAADIRKTLHDFGVHSSTIQPEYINHRNPSESTPRGAACLIPCPPGQECDPSENACCPPPPPEV